MSVMRLMTNCPEPALILSLLGFLLDDDPAVAGAAEGAVTSLYRHVSTDQLPSLDEAMRRHSYGSPVAGNIRWERLAPGQVNALARPDPSVCAFLLGLAACHASGYVRRNAVACLDPQVQSGAEIPFLLLRLGDWVEPVRLQAQSAVSRRLSAERVPECLPHLGLVEPLRAKRRVTQSPLPSRIEEFLQTEAAALLDASFKASGRLARRYGLALAWKAAGSTSATSDRALIVEGTLRDAKDPALRLQIVHWLVAKDADPALQRRFIESLLSDNLPAAEPCAGEIGRERLGTILFGSPSAHVRRQALRLINRLPRWQRAILLVEVVGRGDPKESTTLTAGNYLRDWFANYNRNHAVAPTRQDVAQLDAVLRRYDGALEPRLGRELQALVASWTR